MNKLSDEMTEMICKVIEKPGDLTKFIESYLRIKTLLKEVSASGEDFSFSDWCSFNDEVKKETNEY